MSDTVQALLLQHAERDTPGLKYGDQVRSWRDYLGESAARAHVLHAMADPGRPVHVGVLMQNSPEMAMAIAAGALGGHVTVGINTIRRGESLAADVRRADCQILLTDHRHLALLGGLDLGGATVVDTDDADWLKRVADAPRGTAGFPAVDAMDTFMLIFTSGTSGEPKAVRVANFMAVMSGATLADKFDLTTEDIVYSSMPMFHSNAILAGYAVHAHAGAALAPAQFSASRFLSDLRHYGATYLNYVGKPLAYLLATPEQPDDRDNPLRVAFGNEASDRDIEEFARRFDCTVWDGFGSTETAVIITRTDATPAGSIGQPFDGVAVYDRDTRTECPRAVFDDLGRVTNLDEAVGELVNTTGAGFFAGYYNDEQATSERLDGGMYWSGDLAYRDEAGFVYLAGRTDDWLRVDGENLAAAPIERVLLRNDAVSQAAVYGIPDADAPGDQLMCALVLRDGATLTPVDLQEFLTAQPDLSPKAWPKFVRIATDLPSTATNKVLKRELRAQGTETTDTLFTRSERDLVYRRPRRCSSPSDRPIATTQPTIMPR